jgi:hypothetical protein
MGPLPIGNTANTPKDLLGMIERINDHVQDVRLGRVELAAGEGFLNMSKPTDDAPAAFESLCRDLLNETVDGHRNVRTAAVLPQVPDCLAALRRGWRLIGSQGLARP